MLTPRSILGPGGRIAARLPAYEHRPQQLEMAERVGAALQHGGRLIAEAGTGVGKSFAYLAPAILAATDPDHPVQRVIISTHTISLQEQLLSKDIPLLNAVIPREFSAVLVKGRSNYLSLRRLHAAQSRAAGLFSDEQELEELERIARWSAASRDGSLSDLPFKPRGAVWDETGSDSGNCLGRSCETYNQCFYYRARRRVQNAQILVVNHALFFSDLALRRSGISILPDYDAVVFDEAHTLESVAGDHLGLSVSSGQVHYLLRRLYNDRTNRGVLVPLQLMEAQAQTESCRQAADDFFGDLANWSQGQRHNGRVREPDVVRNTLGPPLRQLADMLRDRADGTTDDSDRKDLESACQRLTALDTSIDAWLKQSDPETVYWLDVAAGRGIPRVKLAAAPVDVGPSLRAELFQRVRTVVLTSATLSSGGSFDFFRSRVGLRDGDELQAGSPFDYRGQAKLVLVRGMPDPAADRAGFEQRCVQMIQRYVERTDGRAFVLFTSYDMMRRTAHAMADWLAEHNMPLHNQADGVPRGLLLKQFLRNPRSVLFGADSFWQGVDVRGDALSNVIITKLPFSVPDQPLLQSRLDAIREAGGNPFQEYQLPEAVIKLRQGFGRLIRSQDDRGMVVILDPRVRTKPYGRVFLDSLPECEVLVEQV